MLAKVSRDKIVGTFLGVAVGDALGMAVETFTAEKIAKTYGRVTTYLRPDGHKWFNGHQAGTYTDDTQLTLAVAEALIEAPLDMDAQVKHHVAAFRKTTDGWGNTTRNAIRSLANGGSWATSGLSGNNQGLGNGVVMKIAPVALLGELEVQEFVFNLNAMTHPTGISAGAAAAHVGAISLLSKYEQEDLPSLDVPGVKREILDSLARYAGFMESKYESVDDKISDRFFYLSENFEKEFTPPALANALSFMSAAEIIEQFGAGSCYCFNSIPFSYAFFFRNPDTIETLFDVISAGGDTDSNGSIVGALLGAYHGTSIFPQYLVDGLVQKDEILDVANRFADKFGD